MDWTDLLNNALQAAGDLDGTQTKAEADLKPIFSATPYKYDGVPSRDERFRDPYNMGVNAEAGVIGEFEDLRTHGRPLTTSFGRLVETFQIERLLAVAHDAPIGRGASQQVRARR